MEISKRKNRDIDLKIILKPSIGERYFVPSLKKFFNE